MIENESSTLDLGKIMKHFSRMNPHVSISDIAYLMDMPYSPDIDDSSSELEINQEFNPGF